MRAHARRAVSAAPDLPTRPLTRRVRPAAVQIAASATAGILAALVVADVSDWRLFPLLAWDGTCVVYATWVWLRIWPLDAEETAQLAVRVDPTRAIADVLALIASVASLVAVGFVLRSAANSSGAQQLGLAGLGVASIALSWAMVHTVYTLRYARLYYSDEDGGIEFHDAEPPCYSDFAYVAFTIGMTFQVSDTDLETKVFRRMALPHALLSYLFGTGIVAAMVNLIASLGGK